MTATARTAPAVRLRCAGYGLAGGPSGHSTSTGTPRARAYATRCAVASRPLDGEPSHTASTFRHPAISRSSAPTHASRSAGSYASRRTCRARDSSSPAAARSRSGGTTGTAACVGITTTSCRPAVRTARPNATGTPAPTRTTPDALTNSRSSRSRSSDSTSSSVSRVRSACPTAAIISPLPFPPYDALRFVLAPRGPARVARVARVARRWDRGPSPRDGTAGSVKSVRPRGDKGRTAPERPRRTARRRRWGGPAPRPWPTPSWPMPSWPTPSSARPTPGRKVWSGVTPDVTPRATLPLRHRDLPVLGAAVVARKGVDKIRSVGPRSPHDSR